VTRIWGKTLVEKEGDDRIDQKKEVSSR